jgi:hypothetical protein
VELWVLEVAEPVDGRVVALVVAAKDEAEARELGAASAIALVVPALRETEGERWLDSAVSDCRPLGVGVDAARVVSAEWAGRGRVVDLAVLDAAVGTSGVDKAQVVSLLVNGPAA